MDGNGDSDTRTPGSVTVDGGAPQPDRGRPVWAGLLIAGAVVVAIGSMAVFGALGERNPAPNSQPPPATATTTTNPPTTTSVDPEVAAALQYEADVELIKQLWWDQSVSWFGGFDSGIQFWVDNNYPDMECTFDDYMASRFPAGPIDGLQIERVVNTPTIEIDEGWVIPGGTLQGQPAKGRVYVMSVRDSSIATNSEPVAPSTIELHVTILEGRAHFFFGCSA